ncbi:MAG: copper resistance CopC/CopD family protein, partial [Candidatus Limnocylindria bacterium]
MRPTGRPWRLAGAAAVSMLLVGPALPGGSGSRVAAHAHLVASSPGSGTVVADSPTELRLVFSEPLEDQFTSLDLVASDGTVLLTRAGEIDPQDRHALVVRGVDLADGVYQITWRTLSAADGHTAEGFFAFAVGPFIGALPGAIGGGMIHTETDPLRVLGRWLTYIGLLLALGLAVFHRVVVRGGPMPRTLVRLLAAGLGISAVATLGVAVAGAVEAGSLSDYLVGSRNGALQVARAVVSAAGAAALILVTPRAAGLVAAVSGLAGIALLVAAGHASAMAGPAPVLGQMVHVAGAAVWIGGIVGLLALVVSPGLLRGRDDHPPDLRTYVPRFSALALVSIGLVALTGVYAAWMQMGTLVTLGTEYGRTLLLKSGLAVGALALGGLNFLDGGRMRDWVDGMRSRLALETIVVAAVLLVTAALAITPPRDDAQGVAIEPVPDAFGEVTPDIDLEILPGRPGVNRIVVLTSEALATGSPTLELALDRLDTGRSTRAPLSVPDMAGMDHGPEGSVPGMYFLNDDGLVEWVADAIVLPAGSDWDTSVVILSREGTELTRQRFSFALDQ